MKTSFDISIPSIPSKQIKFKIQDIKSTAFGSQRNRFSQNKSFLTAKFVDSFTNFSSKRQFDIQTQAQSRISKKSKTSYLKSKQQTQFRYLIPEQKKGLLQQYQKYKQHQPLIQLKKDKGYTFNKTDTQLKKQEKQQSKEFVTQNYYFPIVKQRKIKQNLSTTHHQPSSVFKNQTRNRFYSKLQNKINPLGPGQYVIPEQKIKQKPKIINQAIQQELNSNKIKQIIATVVNQNISINNIDSNQIKKKEIERVDHMFVQDDRDRFGQQKYPIAGRTQVPGPGSYDFKDNIEGKVQKIVLVQQQRKLLKQWFNN